jgi:hypothetical protein
MRVHRQKEDVAAPKSLPKKSHYASPGELLMARLEFIRADRSVAENDKSVLKLGATFECHKMTFNQLYSLLKHKQKETSSSLKSMSVERFRSSDLSTTENSESVLPDS